MLAALVLVYGALIGSIYASPLGFSPADPVSLFKRISSGCSTTGAVSCSSSSVSDTCCTESPGGLLLQTQFWDTDPSTGPTNSWTIHGLWPDNCDGTYQENCDSSRDYTGISSLLTAQGASDTLAFMEEYWLNDDGTSEELWEHEWATHGTCMSTLEPACLPSGSPKGAEAVAFYQTVVKLFKTLPTYTWLANHGITPSSSKTYTLSAITSALVTESGGYTPALDCTSGALSQISWYFNLKGSIIDGVFVPINTPEAGSCTGSSIKYPLKTGSPATSTTGSATSTSTSATKTTTTSTTASSTAPASSIPTKATIHASTGVGGLLSLGTWSTQTLASYTLSGTASSFTLTSSKGSCGVSGGAFSCGSGLSSSFSAVTSGSNLLLAYSGSTSWSSSAIPSGETVETVYTGNSYANDYSLTIVST